MKTKHSRKKRNKLLVSLSDFSPPSVYKSRILNRTINKLSICLLFKDYVKYYLLCMLLYIYKFSFKIQMNIESTKVYSCAYFGLVVVFFSTFLVQSIHNGTERSIMKREKPWH